MIAAIRQRIADVQRERRIRQLARECAAAVNAGVFDTADQVYRRMVREILARSPQAIARMERARGLRA